MSCKCYIIICSTNDIWWNFARDHDNCQSFLAIIRATRKYINKRYTQNRKQTFSLSFSLCSPVSLSLFLPFFGIHSTHFYACLHVCVCVHLLSGTSPASRISPFLSRFHSSLFDSSYFLEKKTCPRIGHSVSASIVSLRVFFFDIYLFVRLYFIFFAHHRHSTVVAFSPIFCYWMLDAKTDI